MPARSTSGYYGFKVIGTLKLLSGVLALAVGIGAVRFLDHDPGPKLERAVTHFGLDPHNEVIHRVVSAITGIDRTHLRAIQAGTFFYALLHTIEGVGLLLERDWAGYLVVLRHQLTDPLRDLRNRQEVQPLANCTLCLKRRYRHLPRGNAQDRAGAPIKAVRLIGTRVCCILLP